MASSTRIPTAYRQWLHAMLVAPVVAAAPWMAAPASRPRAAPVVAAGRLVTGE
ncbi:hypothetical protein [Variovorax sp. MHTC-1]|uniref:hypothetical protein n=1 Tax=Variovorax sp. MHTC-1 TaxID=2495593 RepID=UPI00163C4D14|nr:hypothetical protein [Variovorax sp. MHTC-1]